MLPTVRRFGIPRSYFRFGNGKAKLWKPFSRGGSGGINGKRRSDTLRDRRASRVRNTVTFPLNKSQ
jgi:hypothetical protein